MAESKRFEDIDTINYKIDNVHTPSIMKQYFRYGLNDYTKKKVARIITDLARLDAYKVNLDRLFNSVMGSRSDDLVHHPELVAILCDVKDNASLLGINQYLMQSPSYDHLQQTIIQMEQFYEQQLHAFELYNQTGDRQLLSNFNLANFNAYTIDTQKAFQELKQSFLQYHNFAILHFKKQKQSNLSIMSYKVTKGIYRLKNQIIVSLEQSSERSSSRRKERQRDRDTGQLPQVRSEYQEELDRVNSERPTYEEEMAKINKDIENIEANNESYGKFLRQRDEGNEKTKTRADELLVTKEILSKQKAIRKRLEFPEADTLVEAFRTHRKSDNIKISLLFKKPEDLTKEELELLERMSKIKGMQDILHNKYKGFPTDFFRGKELMSRNPWDFTEEEYKKLKDIYYTYGAKISRNTPSLAKYDTKDAPFSENSTPNKSSAFFKDVEESKNKTKAKQVTQDSGTTKKIDTAKIEKQDSKPGRTTRMQRLHGESKSNDER